MTTRRLTAAQPTTVAEAIEELLWDLDRQATESDRLARYLAETHGTPDEVAIHRSRTEARHWLVALAEAAKPPTTDG